MDNSAIAKLSAYNRVCQKFIDACVENQVEPGDCLLAISRLLGITIPNGPTQASSAPQLASSKTIVLTKEVIEAAKKEAKEAKAKRLGLSPNEVNLTPKEAKDAKAAVRQKLLEKGTIVPIPKSAPSDNSTQVSASATRPVTVGGTPSGSGRQQVVPNPTREKEEAKSGLRATAQTKLKACRKLCLQTMPTAILDPKVIHLVAYSNHLNRLTQQWRDFCVAYQQHSMSNPLRGLADPWKLEQCSRLLQEARAGLHEQPDSPGTYILQSEGSSFWSRDKPSEACPEFLARDLPKAALVEFDTYGASRN